MANIRTPKELSNPKFNYYIALKINLNESNPKNIEEAIKRALSDTSGSLKSIRFFELRNDIIETMINDSIFDKATGTYKQNAGGRSLEAKRASSLMLEDAVELMRAVVKIRKIIFKNEIEGIYRKLNKPFQYFTQSEFFEKLDFLKDNSVKIVESKASNSFRDYEAVNEILKNNEAYNLYQYLSKIDPSITEDSSESDIKKATDALYVNAMRSRTIFEQQEACKIVIYIKKILLAGAKARKEYDDYLMLKAVLWDDMKIRAQYGINTITAEQFSYYTFVVSSGINMREEDAEELLISGLFYYGITPML